MKALALAFALILTATAASAQIGLPWPGPGTAHTAGAAPIALVGGHGSLTQNGGASTTQAATITGTSAGNFITVGIFWCNPLPNACTTNGGTVTGVASSAGETCAQATGAANTATGTGFMTDVWYCKNTVGGNDTITATFSLSVNFAAISIQEWTGVSTTAPDDGVGNKGSSASATSLSVATNGNTTTSGELIYSIAGAQNVLTAGQTQINAIAGNNLKDEYQLSGAGGSYSDSWSQSPADKVSSSLAAFKQ